MNQFSIPRDAYRYILFQRTQYLKSPQYERFYRLAKKLTSFESIVQFESRLFKNHIAISYFADMCRELESMKPHLPQQPSAILDIGCGIAGIDALLFDHYNGRCDLFLLDKTGMEEKVFYHFESRGAVYNSLDLAQKFLTLNGVDRSRITTQEATPENEILFGDQVFDLIFSLISWGYHYPVSTYLQPAFERLRPEGRLIIDVRKGNDQAKQIRDLFGNATVIGEDSKSERILAIKSSD
ncbi:hypothetical protein Mal15_27840 [Stieleria maiorica]|uniref:Methyltransferase type 11 domain-containing protein n=1 Tax=Stieleria maiorica TaxID=2795974 RepID=A0A5B9MDZ9_9BACT|nr:class I SAM-dependent methyltransferase [Stieleria maiorica]QEF98729.1 hypothetical protein Mal15_27840 [Stieleria maiorica]